MFIKAADKKDSTTGREYRYYKLCESYRIENKVRHRTIHILGKLDEITSPQEGKLLADRIEQLLKGTMTLFPVGVPAHIEKLAQYYSDQIKRKGLQIKKEASETVPATSVPESDYQEVDISSVRMEDAREIGSEWLCKQALTELQFDACLREKGWSSQDIIKAQIHIISKACYPASEHKTEQWIHENSGVCELFEIAPEDIQRFHLYKISKQLYQHKAAIEEHLSVKTNELFDLQDSIILCDLTNTYFEGRKEKSHMAQFYKSKEKRSDAKLVALALVINIYGFVKYSKIYRGNISDCETLQTIVEEMSERTSFTGRKPVVVIDAGIATEDNIQMLRAGNYRYVCVSRSKLKDYKTITSEEIPLKDKREQPIVIQWVNTPEDTDKYLYVHSQMKEKKEQSMRVHYSVRYEEALNRLSASIQKKGGVKQYATVLERIGRIKERYPSANKHYKVEVIEKEGKAVLLKWTKIPSSAPQREGVYFLRTNLTDTSEKDIWEIYNTIREIESVFRTLKTDLSLRPVYHQKDENTEAHLYLGILAYTVVNTIRYRLKQHNIHHDWSNIVRIMNTQKLSTISMKQRNGNHLLLRVCSKPIIKAKEMYTAMGYTSMPFYQKKFVFPERRN